jgi:hypothetical protein
MSRLAATILLVGACTGLEARAVSCGDEAIIARSPLTGSPPAQYSADTVDVQRAARARQPGKAAAHMAHHGRRTSWASRRALGWP